MIHLGLGPLGQKVVRFAIERGCFNIVAAVDPDPTKVGKDLGGVCGIKPLGIKVSTQFDLLLMDGYTVAIKVADKSAETVTKATIAAMMKLPPEKVKTMTFDNGKEFAGFKEMERGLDMRSYFVGPYHSW